MFCKEVISVSNKLWIVQRKVKISHNPIIETWREHLKSDNVFKKEPYFYFCKEISEIHSIEET